jgi:hypothetical protein
MTDLNLDELERDTRAVIERLPAGAEMSIEQETLLSLIAAARAAERLRAYLEDMQWAASDYYGHLCKYCGRYESYGHAPDCELALALKGGEEGGSDDDLRG